jgi:hypothetical protein
MNPTVPLRRSISFLLGPLALLFGLACLGATVAHACPPGTIFSAYNGNGICAYIGQGKKKAVQCSHMVNSCPAGTTHEHKKAVIPPIIAVRLSCKPATINVPRSRLPFPRPLRLPGSIPIAYPYAQDAVVRYAPTAAGLESERNAERALMPWPRKKDIADP